MTAHVWSQEGHFAMNTLISRAARCAALAVTLCALCAPVFAQSPPASATIVDLGALSGGDSYGYGVSENGNVTGIASDSMGNNHAFLYTQGHMIDLGTLGGDYSTGYGVNDRGQVVGTSAAPVSGFESAFLWQDGKLINLNKVLPPNSGWTLTEAMGITDSGYITGYGTHTGHRHAYLLQLPAGFAP